MTNHAQDGSTILVLGATGKTGRRVVQRLQARGVPTRAGSRMAQPPFDWGGPDTWAPALSGVSAVYITYFPDLAVPGAPEAVGDLAQMAAEHGVRRIVVAEIAEATGRELRFETVPMEAFGAELARQGLSEDETWLVTYLFGEVLDGRNESLADGIQRALGREPRDLSDYVHATAPTGVWHA